MSIIDTHTHLFVEEFQDDIQEVVTRAKAAGITKAFLPNISEATVHELKEYTHRYPGFFYPMMGLHPTSVTSEWSAQLDKIYNELQTGKYIAVGEVGIDLHWDESLKNEQIKAFETQLAWSRDHDLPLSIHFRNALNEVIESIQRIGSRSLRGVFHSFGGSRNDLERITSLGDFMIGVNGVVTFKNSGLSRALVDCPRDRVVVETDAPYLAPTPYRGKRNESSYLPFIINQLAHIWQIDKAEVEALTTRNALAMFPLS